MSEGYKYTGKRYIASVRASDTTEGTTSTQAQLAMLHEKAASLKMVRAKNGEIVLNNLTGSMPGKRQDMTDVIQRKLTHNDFDVLVVQRIDRVTRSGSGHGFWFEHELQRAGIHLYIVGDDIPEGRYASLIKVAKYEAAREQAFSISQRSTQGYQLALEAGRVTTSSHTPYACWRLYLTADGKPLHIIRDLRDGRQQKLHPHNHSVIDTYGQIGDGSKGHYRKQKHEKVLLMSGDADEIAVIRTIFNLHFRQGWGGKRISDHLNRQSIPSPCEKQWSQRQVEVLYNNEVYTGRSVANRTSAGIYHQRNHATPKPTNLDPAIHATAKTIPVQLRPADEWFVTDQPLLKDLLGDDQLRALAIDGQDRYWRHQADPDRPKLSKSKHKTSDYLLSGILHAKQDGGALVGVLCGRVGKKVRYYRHRRGRRGYMKGNVFNKMIPAESVEKAVIDAMKETLLDGDNLKAKLIELIATQAQPTAAADVDNLQRQRDRLKKRTELIVSTLDEETLAEAQAELAKLKAERRRLDEQIATAITPPMPNIDAETLAAEMNEKTKNFFAALPTMPKHLLREWLASVVSSVIVDMETKAIEIYVQLPKHLLETAFLGEKAMRLVSTSASSTSYETHRQPALTLAVFDCQYVKHANPANSGCFDCRRRAA
jgi:DNA invertase Pin-like site-specific DNA recombinase